MDPLTSGQTDITAITGNLANALDDISKIPDGSSGGSLAAFTYNTPLTTAASTSTVSSNLPTLIGDSSTDGTLIGDFYSNVETETEKVTSIGEIADTYRTEMTAFSLASTGLRDGMAAASDEFAALKTSLTGARDAAEPLAETADMVLMIFEIVLIVLGAFSILGLILMGFCQCFKCRYLVYLVCFLFLLLGALCFLVSLMLSLFMPFYATACLGLETAVSSDEEFGNTDLAISGKVKTAFQSCLPGADGRIFYQLEPTYSAMIYALADIVHETNSYSAATNISGLQTERIAASLALEQYKTGALSDLSDKSSIVRVSDPSNYAGCSVGNFQDDSWVPATVQPNSYAPCLSSGGDATATSCTRSADFDAAADGCTGCMNTYSLFESGNTTAAHVKTALDSRYGSSNTDCDTFGDEMSNLWAKYYRIRKPKVEAMETNYASADSSIAILESSLSDLETTITSVLSDLAEDHDDLTNPETGMVAGLGCALIG